MGLARLGLRPRLSALYASSFAGIGVYMPFFPLWLEHRALSLSEIGLVLALPVVVRIVVTAPLMSLIDRSAGVRQLMITAHLFLIVIYAALAWTHGVWAIALLVVTMAAAQAPIIPTADLVVMEGVRRNPGLDYGRLRLWGSITFLLASVASGYLLGALDPDVVVGVLAALAAVGVGVSWLAVPSRTGSGEAARGPSPEGQIRERLPRSLVFVIAAAALVQASHAAVYAFGSIHWRETGMSSVTIGISGPSGWWPRSEFSRVSEWSSASGGPRSDFSPWGAGAAAIRFAAMTFEPGLLASFGLQALHGLSFGMTHLGTIAAVAWLAPENGRARVQGVLSAVLAFGTATSTVLSGMIFRSAGSGVFLAMVPLAAGGLACALLAARYAPDQPHKAGRAGEPGCRRSEGRVAVARQQQGSVQIDEARPCG
jgi:PPP family 3-phenylpropionic acid transporter